MSDAFVPRSSHPSTEPLFAGAALLDAEKLDCYRIALEFQGIAGQLVPKRGYAELRDQLDRASISIVLNIAEGCGRRSPADKGRFRTGSGTSTKGNTSGRNEGSHVEAALGEPCGPDKQPSNNVLKLPPPPVHHKSVRPPQ